MACKQCGRVALMGKCSRCKIVKAPKETRGRSYPPLNPTLAADLREAARRLRGAPLPKFKPLKLEIVEEPEVALPTVDVAVFVHDASRDFDLREAARRLRETAIQGRSR